MRIFLAGATGAIGRPLVPRLLAAGHEVTGLTRSPESADRLRQLGAHAVVGDALDAEGLKRSVRDSRPEVVIDQLTDLRRLGEGKRMARALAATDRLRTEGTRHLVEAAVEAGARRVLAQSVAFFYADGSGLRTEEDPLDLSGATPPTAVEAVREHERLVGEAPGIEGLVLRYGFFYGPGTAYASDGAYAALVRRRGFPVLGRGEGVFSFLHVEDAATATALALTAGGPGVYNVVDDDPVPLAEWLPAYARLLGAPPPRRLPAWLGRLAAGAYVARLATRLPGASNAKARATLGWSPRFASWRQGFESALG